MTSELSTQDLLRKIQREKDLITGAMAMQASTTSDNVRTRLGEQICKSEEALESLQQMLLSRLRDHINSIPIQATENIDSSDRSTAEEAQDTSTSQN